MNARCNINQSTYVSSWMFYNHSAVTVATAVVSDMVLYEISVLLRMSVFRVVCRYLRKSILVELDLRYINVNAFSLI